MPNLAAANALGGQDAFLAAHVRLSNGRLCAVQAHTVRCIWYRPVGTHKVHELAPLNVPLFIATDIEDTPTLAPLLAAFPCTFLLRDLVDVPEVRKLGHLVSGEDGSLGRIYNESRPNYANGEGDNGAVISGRDRRTRGRDAALPLAGDSDHDPQDG
ncbi:hypothetical protein BGW80DRAFT_1248872 [Lactifluus volemus]|nr:hypothetical protein BGW80DRAFT_1248872 [Lactifluus volemus]